MVRQVYLAATGQNRGKTTVSLGLVDGFRRRGLHTGFIKPVGQRTVIDHGQPADEDAVLMKSIFDLPESYSVMSPVHIPRGFTKAYIAGKVVEDLGARIQAAHREFADHDLLLIEGTGHAGVGAVIGLSNAVVAAMLGAPAVIVSEGGVGRPIDEIVLNASHFQAYGVRVPARSSTRSGSTSSRASRTRSAEASESTGSRCWASCPTGRSCRTRRWA